LNILFICTGNICRSIIAEHVFRKKAQDAGLTDVATKSAGVAAAEGLTSPEQIYKIIARYGAAKPVHCAQPFTGELADWADLILAMDAGHQMAAAVRFPRIVGKVHVLKSYVGAPGPADISDPFGRAAKHYEAGATDIETALDLLIQKLKDRKP
jgi:protein-tyrosine phosphatase